MKKIIIIMILLPGLMLSSCSRLSYVERQNGTEMVSHPHIRVRILNADNIEIDGEGTYRLNCFMADSTSKGYYSVTPLKLTFSGKDLTLSESNGLVLDRGLLKVYVSSKSRGSHIILNGRKFRGMMEIWTADEGIEVINVLNIEDYLKGVLPPEMGRLEEDAFEALKAQSVAARTYAYSRIAYNSEKNHDLVNDIMDQVYIGTKGEYNLANKAIEETRGEILTYNGEAVIAYYHSTCGGFTEEAANVWDQGNNSYLRSIDDSDYCEWSKFHDWEMTWNAKELASYLRDYLHGKRGFNDKSLVITDIEVVERFPSGRIANLKVLTDHGEFLFFKDQIRWAFRRPERPDLILPSSHFEIQLWQDSDGSLSEITATGKGYGHGVGMCQTGAIGRARLGQDYRQILKTYYYDADISKAY
ncbi:MAG: SpoIID/LytB domain-containing protein [candidate division Zixibacteria bacterium]|nr:SpoIID/LytB domain-containing protein [candidate division Zixibacteria bacterium]NIR67083.1 SpoIID/LytB domain-containing protein [candidate division Zixibacteria bacterium]NIS15739.1 SpoIID/LytB domain-containing protein [candidate division Zixibacteria bacterium]NIS48495.1 SpoIID/LytB domain-containing protein [candidate division Zixibacteria bacterium]NIT52222.1 SpoIID/LytB domain-containing protein [candidate division Zixibacteria bacterium]